MVITLNAWDNRNKSDIRVPWAYGISQNPDNRLKFVYLCSRLRDPNDALLNSQFSRHNGLNRFYGIRVEYWFWCFCIAKYTYSCHCINIIPCSQNMLSNFCTFKQFSNNVIMSSFLALFQSQKNFTRFRKNLNLNILKNNQKFKEQQICPPILLSFEGKKTIQFKVNFFLSSLWPHEAIRIQVI